jgi:hypothetical protein
VEYMCAYTLKGVVVDLGARHDAGDWRRQPSMSDTVRARHAHHDGRRSWIEGYHGRALVHGPTTQHSSTRSIYIPNTSSVLYHCIQYCLAPIEPVRDINATE